MGFQMSSTRTRPRLGFLTFLVLLLAFVAGTGGRLAVSAAAGPFTNAGFESGTAGWTFVGPDSATVVGTEGPAQFAAYANTPDGDITVTPNLGQKMARLGTPKAGNSSQAEGINSVSQTFTPASSTFSFAARLFSWEPRANTDYVKFSFTKANGNAAGQFQAFSFQKKDGTVAASCAAGASVCSSSIKVGKSGDYLSSLGPNSVNGWVIIKVTGLPTTEDVTFTASVGSTANNSKASWLYLDSVNSPPVAAFDFKYPTVSLSGGINGPRTTEPLEGSPIQFKDQSYDPDAPGDKIVSWEWTVTGLNGPLTVQNPFFVPHNEGSYSVTLKVTDSFGATGALTKTINVLNAPPLVNALNVEALAGKPFPVTGRFTDAGWTDTHSATWTGPAVAADPVQEDHAPALGTGKVTGRASVPAAGTTSASLTVSDGLDAKSDPFTITALSDTSSLVGHTEFDSARPVTIDGSYLGVLPQPRSRSVYEIKWPGSGTNGAQELPAGSEVLVNLKDLPADYDLILVTVGGQPSKAPAGYAFSGYAFSGFAFSGYAFSDLPNLVSPYAAGYAFSGSGSAGYAFSGLQRAAYGEAGYAFSDAGAAGYAFSGYAFSGYAFSGYAFSDSGGFASSAFSPYAVGGYAFSPISQMGYTGLQSGNTSPSDVALSELGLGTIPANTSVVGYSANRGLAGETVLARIDSPGTKLYAIVVGANGAYSPEPFRLDVEGSMTITSAALNADAGAAGKVVLTGATCAPRFTGSTALAPFGGPSLVSSTTVTNPKTLFVTQQQRLQALHPEEAASWPSFVTDMQTLAARPDVNGKIISVDSAPYSAWDAAPCSIEGANAVSDAVRTRIQAELAATPSIQYVVILGDDDVVPFRRVPDQVSIGNERSYLSSSFLKQGTPLYASVAGGYNLTDDCNVDALPTPWQGRELCIPDKVVSRMVETPSEIAGQARAFIASNGLLNAATQKTAMVSGYDFFADGSEAVAKAVEAALFSVTRLISPTWTAADLRCKLLGLGAGCTTPSAPSVSDANAHFTHYAGLSANGFNTGGFDDIVTSSDVATAAALNKLVGKLVFTIGCHAGFSAPDRAIADLDPSLGVNAKLDFAQAFAQAQAVYIASTGYGIGDDSGISGTEGLLVYYAKELARPGASAGQALVNAKRAYMASLTAASVYDEKSSINLTLYGLPMYSLGSLALAPISATSPLTAATAALTTAVGASDFAVTLNHIPQGDYYSSVGGDAAAPPYRPLQPRKVFPVDNTANTADGPVHGILWTSGGFTDTAGFNPVISRPAVEWEKDPTEPQVCYTGFWPSELFRVNTLDDAQGALKQTVVVTPGQFRCDGLNTAGEVRGTQRIFNTLGWQMLRSTNLDVTPPSLSGLDIDVSTDPLKPLTLKISALDPLVGAVPPSGIARIVVLRISPASGSVTAVADQPFTPAPSGTFPVNIPNPGNDRLIIQIIDAAGNVGVYTAKGPGLRILNVDLGQDRDFDNNPVSFTASVGLGLPIEPTVSPVSYFWDFDDGTTATTSTNSINHTFSQAKSEYIVKLRVTDSNGGIGIDRVTVRNYCRDPLGDVPVPPDASISAGQADFVGCAVSNVDTKLTITLRTASALVTTANPVPPKIRYTVNVAVGNGPAKNLSYREGSATGLRSLVVTLNGDTISFSFDQRDVGWTPGKVLNWFAETQGGVEGTQGAGSLDRMKDAGSFSYGP